MVSDRAARSLILLALLASVLAGCASLPASGPVRKGDDLQLERDDTAVRQIGQPPVAGADPDKIVLGFLRAGADFQDGHAVARQYLAPSIRERWRPNAGAAIYDRTEGDVSVTSPRGGEVTVVAPAEAHIDKEGQYIAAAPGARVERSFRLRKVSGEWRISALDHGLLLARSSVPVIYRQLNLYFPSPSRKVLVPDPVFLPALPGLPTKLVNRLLRGPTSALRGAVTTGFPRGTSLAVSSVPIRDGVATVRLDAGAATADETAREVMSAQLVWTLKQLPEFRFLRVTIDDQPIGVSGASDPQREDSWLAYNPAAVRGEATAYAVQDGRAGQLIKGEFVPVPGAAGDRKVAVRSVAVSTDLIRLAMVAADGSALLMASLRPARAPTRRLQGIDLSAPSWDSLGNVWIAERANGGLWLVPQGGGKPVAVPTEDFKIGPVRAVRVARDGARVALVAGGSANPRLYVAAVVREPDGPGVQLRAVREVLPELRRVRDVAWAEPNRLAVIAHVEDDADVPLLVGTSGYDVSLMQPEPGLISIAAAPADHPVLVGTASGRLQQYTASGEWKPIAKGANPAYPG